MEGGGTLEAEAYADHYQPIFATIVIVIIIAIIYFLPHMQYTAKHERE